MKLIPDDRIKFCIIPRRLVRDNPLYSDKQDVYPRFEIIGWVWFKKVRLTYNQNMGWVCFLERKDDIDIFCKICGKEL